MNLLSVVMSGDKQLDPSENANLRVFAVVESRRDGWFFAEWCEEEIVAYGTRCELIMTCFNIDNDLN